MDAVGSTGLVSSGRLDVQFGAVGYQLNSHYAVVWKMRVSFVQVFAGHYQSLW